MGNNPMYDRVADIIEKERQELVELALDIGGMPSNAGKERPVAEKVVHWLQENDIEAFLQPITDESANAIGVLRGTDEGRSLLLNAHLDTGTNRGGLSKEAQRVEHGFVEGDLIYGTGIINCRGQVVAFMVAARTLKNAGVKLKGDLYIAGVAFETGASSVDETQGINYPGVGMGSRWLIDRGVVTDFALVGETSGFEIATAQCGHADLKIRVPGRGVNTARLDQSKGWQESTNAFEKAGHILVALGEWSRQYTKRSSMEFYGGVIVPKAQVRTVKGGPGYCDIHMSVNIAPETDPRVPQREIQGLIRTLGLECSVTLYNWARAHIARNAEPIIEAVRESHRYVFGEDPPPASSENLSIWRDPNCFNEVGIPCINYGPPRQFEPYTEPQDRAMKIDDLVAATKVYALTVMELCGIAES